MPEREMLEKERSRAVQQRPAESLGTPDDIAKLFALVADIITALVCSI